MKTMMPRMMEHSAENQKHRKMNSCTLVLALMAVTLSWGTAGAQAQSVHGAGTAGTIPIWINSSTLGNSMMSQSSGLVNVAGGVSAIGAVNAGSFTGNGSGLSNVNAATLGGYGSSAFALVGASNTFTASQTIEGNLNLTGSVNDTLTLQGNLNGSGGDVGANVIGGFGGNSSAPGNSVASGVLGATIAGGGGSHPSQYGFVTNTVTANWGTVGGGGLNTVGGLFSTIGGGHKNTAMDYAATVGGGFQNFAEADGATVSGGTLNQANGAESVVPGGYQNVANGDYSFAAGVKADAINVGSFVWGDGNGLTTDTGAFQFVARASGGFTFYTGPGIPVGATLPSGSGSWSSLSDRNVKDNFGAVDGTALLARLAALPIATWNYKAQADSIRHMGPTAQDFRAAFGLGEDERHISTVDSEGVALAAIQALYKLSQQQVQELTRQVNELQNQVARLTGTR